jgi:hypothetical protein
MGNTQDFSTLSLNPSPIKGEGKETEMTLLIKTVQGELVEPFECDI